MTWNDHGDRGDTRHEHGYYDLAGVAEEHHQHHDLESELRGLREDLNRAVERIRELESAPEPEPAEYDPGPEADDEDGMSEHRHGITGEEPW